MPSPLNQPVNDFMVAYEHWDIDRLFLDIAEVSGRQLSRTAQRFLRGTLLYKSPIEIAKICNYGGKDISKTVRDYLCKEIYPAVRLLLNLPETESLTSKLPLKLKDYHLQNTRQSIMKLKTDLEASEVEEADSTENNAIEELFLESLDDIEPYLVIFAQLCKDEQYVRAFYTIFDHDNDDNCVYTFLSSAGYINEVVQLYEQLLKSWKPRKSEKWEFGTALTCLAGGYQRLGSYSVAIKMYKRSLKISREIEDPNGEAGALINLGYGYYLLEQYAEAISFNCEGLDIARQIGNRQIQGYGLNNLGLIYEDLEDYFLAIDYHYHALELRQERHDLTSAAGSLINIGNNYRHLNQNEKAYEILCKGVEVAKESGYRQFEANGWFNLGLALKSLDQKPDAVIAFQQAHNLFQDMGLHGQSDDTASDMIQQLESSM